MSSPDGQAMARPCGDFFNFSCKRSAVGTGGQYCYAT